jgi:sec-independent protein translocase protein TatA
MSIGVWQVILVLVIVLIIFGAGKLPRVMGDVAKGIKNFKSGLAEPEDKAPEKGERDSVEAKRVDNDAAGTTGAGKTESKQD